jgi:hypothetical protein
MAAGDRPRMITYAEVARRLDRAAEAIGLDLDEVLALQRAVLPERFESAPPAAPCDHVPGTAGKMQALAERAAAGQSLWHARDAGDALDVGLESYGEGTNVRGRTGKVCCLRVTGEGYRPRGEAPDAAVRRTHGGTDPGGDLLSGQQLAAILGVAPETISRWAKRGRIPRSRGPEGRPGYCLREVRAALEAAGHRLPS